ncbi:MAG: putative zinc-binding metallopeptidase, partial [Gammaproteobacteria bacterium]
MKQFHCDHCGATIFFDSKQCVGCASRLGFDPQSRSMLAISPVAGQANLFATRSGQQYKLCDNGVTFDVCNWLIAADSNHSLCRGCQFNRTVPNQSLPHNERRWRRLEEAKKRLLFTLMSLQIPLTNGWQDPERGLLLDFIEDSRQPHFAETFVTTGFLGGVITINALEADDVARISTMQEMNESYRTVLGHLRHESGHYYWSRLNPDANTRADFMRTFGDPDQDYSLALEAHYRDGPAANWREQFISAYASAHPAEDWAESWGHYLHIY